MSDISLDTIANLAKRRGFIFQASEIYGGLAGFWDYGPYGVELANNLKRQWWKAMVLEHRNIFGIDGAIIQNPKLWKASGHVAGFADPMVEDTVNNKRYRADHLAGVDTNDLEELARLLKDKKSPDGNPLSEPRVFNMMMKTWVGAVEDDTSVAYLRPETAGPMYTNYENVRETTRSKIPFGIAQIGKAFRNEISPRDFIFRVRELEQMEMQYFIKPDMQDVEYQRWRDWVWNFCTEYIGLTEENLQWHEHEEDERAHYAKTAHDIYFKFPHGFKELSGTHNRTDFDLRNHMQASGRDLSYFDEASHEKYVPNVVESTIGLGRLFIAVLSQAYTQEEVNGETRTVLKIKPTLAPVKIAVLPLSKRPDLNDFAEKVYKQLVKTNDWNIEYDETQSIGKRYRRQDEIGTPYCITVDFDSLEDQCVTIRNRDTMEQVRVKVDAILEQIHI